MFLSPSRYEIRTSVRVKALTVLSSVLTSYGHWYEVGWCAVVQVMSNATSGPWMQLIISLSAAWSALNYWYSLLEVPFRGFLLRPHKTEPGGCIMIFHFELSTNFRFFSVQLFCVWFPFVRLCFHERKDVFCCQRITSRVKKGSAFQNVVEMLPWLNFSNCKNCVARRKLNIKENSSCVSYITPLS